MKLSLLSQVGFHRWRDLFLVLTLQIVPELFEILYRFAYLDLPLLKITLTDIENLELTLASVKTRLVEIEGFLGCQGT